MEAHTITSEKNYELLIRLDEQFKNLTREVRESTNTIAQRVAVLETNKVERIEATRHEAEDTKIHDDFEKRLRIIEISVDQIVTKIKTWGTIGGVVLALLQVFLRFI